MSVEGWYYLHINGDVIYKRELGGTEGDLRESDFVVGYWPFDPTDRERAWQICIEATAAGVPRSTVERRVKELADKWGLTDKDAQTYARRVGVKLWRDGDMWCAGREDFEDLQSSPCGFGATALDAFVGLAKELDFKLSKRRSPSFADLVNARRRNG